MADESKIHNPASTEPEEALFFNIPPKPKHKSDLIGLGHPKPAAVPAAPTKNKLVPSPLHTKGLRPVEQAVWLLVVIILLGVGGFFSLRFVRQRQQVTPTEPHPAVVAQPPPE